MRYVGWAVVVVGMWASLLALSASTSAQALGGTQAPSGGEVAQSSSPRDQRLAGGAQAPSAPLAGGNEYGVSVPAARSSRHPLLSGLWVPRSALAGPPPQVALQVNEPGVGTVRVQLTVSDARSHRSAIHVDLGWVHTSRKVAVRWPKGARLSPGVYTVGVSASDHQHHGLVRKAHTSSETNLTVTAPPPTPAPVSPSNSPPAPHAVFPVAGAHSFGDDANRFGAQRQGHIHQGQDVLAAEGTPVVAPLDGSILTVGYQAAGAGYYAVEHTGVGLDFMFAHCKASSLTVASGQSVKAGQVLCLVGQTGDATAPHLHFEIWTGGWQSASGQPIDPLPYLQEWERG
jgi:murein DD-endopeptidase MepM/ murein hydrolase activator NlpD